MRRNAQNEDYEKFSIEMRQDSLTVSRVDMRVTSLIDGKQTHIHFI